MKIHLLESAEALRSLHSRLDGLTEAEARRRLREFGPNAISVVKGQPLLLRFGKEFTHFFALLLWFAAGLAFFAEWRAPGQNMATLGYAILGVILINGCFSFWQEYRAERAIASLQRLLPAQVKVIRAGIVRLLEVRRLVPGDIIALQEGDNIPADCRLIESFGLRVNNATVTGESRPQARDALPCITETPLHARNIVLAGTSVVSGEGRAVVFHTAMYTEFGKIAELTQSTPATLSPLQQEITRLSRIVATLAIGVGVLFFLLGQAAGLTFWQNFIFAIGIIVANVPEGLLPTVTLSLAIATQRMAKRNVLIRHLPSVETLGSATVICTDKTGTLTENRMAVRQLYLDGVIRPVDVLSEPVRLRYQSLWACARLCHNLKPTSHRGRASWLGDPMEIALVEMADAYAPGQPLTEKIDEIPFDTDRKRMSMLFPTEGGRVLYTKGALESLLPLCYSQLTVEGEVPLTDSLRQQWLAAEAGMAEQGLRVLALTCKAVEAQYQRDTLEQRLTLTGLVGLEDPPRPEVPAAILRCHEAGIRVIMMTGDHPRTAVAIAREIGLLRDVAPLVLAGDELLALSATQLQLLLDHEAIIFARLGADQKMRIVEALKRKNHIVAMTGDGVNDAPALKRADIGIAMGLSGTDVAKESADMILLDDNFASIVSAIEEGRAVFSNIRKFIVYVLTSNVAELVPYLAFALFGLPLPLTIIQVLMVDLGTDMVPALGLGADKPDPTCMQASPRAHQEKLLNWPLLLRAYLFLGVMEAALSMAGYGFVLLQGGWHFGQSLASDLPLYRQATTACFSGIVIGQIVMVFLCKHPDRPLSGAPIFNNPLILAGVVLEIILILLIDYTPWGNEAFGTLPIAGDVWLFLLSLTPFVLLMEAFRKWCVRQWCRILPREKPGMT
ncbi:MAG: cation-translocating P-type ATPase [Methylococcaceae bacterium]|jgi:sodium/potassium-transporting ATPase subunit alpha